MSNLRAELISPNLFLTFYRLWQLLLFQLSHLSGRELENHLILYWEKLMSSSGTEYGRSVLTKPN